MCFPCRSSRNGTRSVVPWATTLQLSSAGMSMSVEVFAVTGISDSVYRRALPGRWEKWAGQSKPVVEL